MRRIPLFAALLTMTALAAGEAAASPAAPMPPMREPTDRQPVAPRGDIIRHANVDPASPILQAVTIPPNAEWLLLSGIVPYPLDRTRPARTAADYGDTRTQARSVFARIEAALAARGYAMADVVRLTVYLVADPATGRMDFDGFNAAYRDYFGTPANPAKVARSTVEVKALAAPGLLVEIEATAARTRH